MRNNLLKRICLISIMAIQIFVSGPANAQLAKCKGKYFGNIISNSVQSNYNGLWNQMTMENSSKWQATSSAVGVYNFNGSDIGFNWAKTNGGLFKYHTLMWGAQTAGWVANASSATIQAEIPKYFKAVADHYAPMGGLKLIDVLNEPINTPVAANLKNALTAGYKAEPANAGDINNQYGWAIWCFQLARKNFPTATLLINEFNIEMNWNNCRAPYIAMSNAIKNAPNLTDGRKNLIDGIGLQAHGIESLTGANFKACLDEIWTKTGLPLHITEFDATVGSGEAKQQSVYSTLIPIAWEHPHVAGITLWGFIEGQTWITGSGLINNGQDRPAMTWLRSYFAGRPSLPCCPAPAPFAACNGSTPPTVSFTSPADNSSFTQGTAITLTATATDADGTVASVKFYDGTTLLISDIATPYTYNWTGATLGSHTVKAVATDNSGNTTEAIITIKVNVPQGPYNGIVHPIPGIIQLEEYDLGGNGIAYMDNTPGSDVTPVVNFRTTEDVDIETCTDAGGGYNLGFTAAGEWLEYTVNVQSAGNYDLDIRVACMGDARTVTLAMDGTTFANNVAIPNTAGWQTWATTSVKTIPLKVGKQIMRLTIGATDYVNLNYIQFKASTVTGLEKEENSTFSIFPNPFTSEGLHISKQGEYLYRISDLSGDLVESGIANGQQVVGKNLASGVYFISIEQHNASKTYKIVRQ
ncbi:MAG: endo-1,4-beta-xylanase [Opitutaceae bacterium]|nr:endo-1,4-beta-xylanase [Cytophagales bacterium]